MAHTYVVIDDDQKSLQETVSVLETFSGMQRLAIATTFEEGLDAILEYQPDVVLMEIKPITDDSGLSIHLINELYRYMHTLPTIIVVSHDCDAIAQAMSFGVHDFLAKPLKKTDIRKSFLKYEKVRGITPSLIKTKNEVRQFHVVGESDTSNPILASLDHQGSDILQAMKESFSQAVKELSLLKEAMLAILETNPTIAVFEQYATKIADILDEKFSKDFSFDNTTIVEEIKQMALQLQNTENIPAKKREVICIKSYGDYRFLDLSEIAFLKADNNSTDITLYNGEQITAFKNLKHFEENLPSNYFRIHNSFIVNQDFISRIHTGNNLCYIKNSKHQIPFSKGYKDNVELILAFLAGTEHKEV